jgi:hypothetical protein
MYELLILKFLKTALENKAMCADGKKHDNHLEVHGLARCRRPRPQHGYVVLCQKRGDVGVLDEILGWDEYLARVDVPRYWRAAGDVVGPFRPVITSLKRKKKTQSSTFFLHQYKYIYIYFPVRRSDHGDVEKLERIFPE